MPLDRGQIFDFVGGARRNRTDDLFNAIEALSQLSYGPEIFKDPMDAAGWGRLR
jgi:hypothetical protein